MSTAGYSGTALIKKLGIKDDMKILLIHAPNNYFSLLEKDISQQLVARKQTPDFVHLFAVSKKIFELEMKKLAAIYKSNSQLIIWVSWYKKTAGIATDLTETDIRNYACQHGLVDVKVCAVSNQWSGLKLVVPLALRKN